ncbi:trans-aconitate 2-methyltransferase [Candidatus Lokiarchaeum ossiferum]|uniref:trans-aconitate 2-methyltransferase n=1 Tax=Candidatus Lokiarchaeum ossiferum TaxID=2951803 RepID=UPI00352CC7B0
MGFFHEKENVEKYIKMAEGYDGKELIKELTNFLPTESSILEIGIGPGVDFLILEQYFQVTGSDNSQVFVDRFKKRHPSANVLNLDAVSLKTEIKYQGLYSNKVLHHLSRDQLKQSILRQADILQTNGIICHSFWQGDKEENMDGLLFIYYTMEQLQALFQEHFQILKMEQYQEMEPNDSIYLIAKKK